MAALSDWVRRLALLVIVVGFLELLAPSNGLKRYVRLVAGFLVLTAVLSPLLALVKGGDFVERASGAAGQLLTEGRGRRIWTAGGSGSGGSLPETNRLLQNELLADRLSAYLETELGKEAGSRVGVAVRVSGQGVVERVSLTVPPGTAGRVARRAAALSGLSREQILVIEEAIR